MKRVKELTYVQQLALRQELEDDFLFFVTFAFQELTGKEFILSSHHRKIAQLLVDVYNGLKQYVIINIPPRYSKTEMVDLFTAWTYLKNPDCQYIHSSYSDGLVTRNSNHIKSVLSLDSVRLLWPDVEINQKKNGATYWETTANGAFYAAPSGGQITGFGAGSISDRDKDGNYIFSGALTIDDPLKPDDANSDAMRVGINSRWDETFKSRLNSPRTPVIVIMQRLHEDDFTATLLEDTEFQWHRLVLPAIISTEQGEQALWPEKHSIEALKGMKEKNLYMFSSQMMQDPTPRGGGIIKQDWLRFHNCNIPDKIEAIRMFIIADTAMKTKEHNDFSALSCFIECPDIDKWRETGGKTNARSLYLVNLAHGKWEAPQLRKRAVNFWRECCEMFEGLMPDSFYIEDKASGTGLIQTLQTEENIPVIAIQREKDKITRAYSSAPFIESGKFFIKHGERWTQTVVNELIRFSATMSHKHDDICDTIFDAIEKVARRQPAGLYMIDAEDEPVINEQEFAFGLTE